MQEPWFVGGDYNSLLRENERIGGDPVTYTNAEDFIACEDNHHLQEANYTSSVFTWNNNQGSTREFSRLDRILLNEEAVRVFAGPYFEVLHKDICDHCPLLLHLHNTQVEKKHQFHFFNMCTKSLEFKQMAKREWTVSLQGSRMF